MEKIDIRGMIESVLADLTSSAQLETFALKIQMIARMLKNNDFASWTEKELNGYEDKNKVPDYRVLRTHVIADLVVDNGVKAISLKNHNMPLYLLGKEIENKMSTIFILESVIVIEKMSQKDEIGFTVAEFEKHALGSIYKDSIILNAYKPINPTSLQHIVYQFKSKLLDTFMDFNDNLFNDEIDFDIMSKQPDIQRIVNNNINAGVVNMGEGTINVKQSNIEK
ncbi:MAG: hypothetical protein ACK5HZ_00970 [Macellibacteroides fermentans]|uniref:AbiTii domain-containing protein n=1 Tax=Macellibacteroides fermentans TaxID=879969 RepID=UPI003AC0586A